MSRWSWQAGRLAVLAFALFAITSPSAEAAPARLEWVESPRLLDCGAGTVPCFRLTLNIVDERGAAAGVELPDNLIETNGLSVRLGEHDVRPFYAAGISSTEKRGRVALVLVDVSGSMNNRMSDGRSRFEISKVAALNFLEGFQAGADRIAIVPFASRGVAETIRQAKFATTWEEARQQVLGLPVPETRNNTGLYSAVSLGIDRIERELKQVSGSPEALLLVMTDGRNDVRPGDDPDLLTGPAGLALVEQKVKGKGIQVFAVGFGDSRSIDEAALRRISTKSYLTDNPGELARVFGEARALLNSRLRLTLRCPEPWRSRSDLAGQPLHFRVALQLTGQKTLYSAERVWNPPQMSIPMPDGACDEAEKAAYIQSPNAPTSGPRLRPLLVFVGLSLLLAILWFLLPRLIWRPRYVEEAAEIKPDRFAMTMRTRVGGYQGHPGSVEPPAGFGRKKAPEGRAPVDRTVVQPRRGDGTRTRLN